MTTLFSVVVKCIHTRNQKFHYDIAPFLLVQVQFFFNFPLCNRFKQNCYVALVIVLLCNNSLPKVYHLQMIVSNGNYAKFSYKLMCLLNCRSYRCNKILAFVVF